jgi:thiamine pyrophosphate-dependent acetolactate synthase large subunit-like protein
MSYGFARAANKPSVVTVTEGPGVTNMVTGIGAAFKGNVPVISITGVQESIMRERDATQDMDQIPFMRPITKWAYSIPYVDKVQEAVRKAFRVALTEPQGPAHIEAASEVLLQQIAPETTAPAAYRHTVPAVCDPAQIDAAWNMISKAQRPLFVIGRGVMKESAVAAMQKLTEATGIPAAALQYSPDAFPASHPMALGPLGRNGFASANRAAPQADVIIAVGAHFDVFSTLYKYGIFSENAKIIHQTSAAGQIGIVFPVALGIAGSATSFIDGLAARAAKAGARKPWLDVAKLRAEGEAELQAVLKPEAEPIQPQFVAHIIRKALPENGILVVDAGNGGKHVRSYFKSYEPDTFLCMDDWASVGGALPIAMGVKLARPDRPVLCTGGDMGAMCNIGELETAVRENIPVVYVVFNDEGLGNERAFQNEHFGGRYFAVDYKNPDFGALAKVFGAHGERVTKPQELEGAIKRAFASGKPAVIDVMIDQNSLAPVIHR